MYNKGEKLKFIACIIMVIGTLLSVAYGLYLFVLGLWALGILVVIVGVGISYIYKLFVDCFADVVQRVDIIDDKTMKIMSVLEPQNNVKEQAPQIKKTLKTTQLDNVKEEVRHLNAFEKQYIIDKNSEDYNEIKELTLSKLYSVVAEKEERQEYIYMCCFEIIERETNKNK